MKQTESQMWWNVVMLEGEQQHSARAAGVAARAGQRLHTKSYYKRMNKANKSLIIKTMKMYNFLLLPYVCTWTEVYWDFLSNEREN